MEFALTINKESAAGTERFLDRFGTLIGPSIRVE